MAPSAFPRDHNSGPVSSRAGPLETFEAFGAPGPLDTFEAFGAPGPLDAFESRGVFTVLVDDDTREGTGLSCMVELIRLTSSSSVSFYRPICPRTQSRSLEKITLASGAEVTDSLATASSL